MKTLVIWFKNGHTAYFEQVTDFETLADENDSVIGFNYFGVTSKVKRRGVFSTKNIAGFALSD